MCLVSASVSENDVFQSLVVYTNITFVFLSLQSLSQGESQSRLLLLFKGLI